MSVASQEDLDSQDTEGLPFQPAAFSSRDASGRPGGAQVCWKVKVRADGHKVVRDVEYGGKPWDSKTTGWEPEGVIWPTWPAGSEDEGALAMSPLADVQNYWISVSNRLRDSAKWMATVLGAALATVVGASPLAGLRTHHFQGIAITLGLVRLAFPGVTMFLVLQVMQPQSVSYTDVQSAVPTGWPRRSPLNTWRDIVESQEDLYLPCGLQSLDSLRQSMIIEEVTLQALARARATARDLQASEMLCQAQTARAARLLELRTASARIATVGEYYKLRARSTRATYGGVLAALIGTAAIVADFAWPAH